MRKRHLKIGLAILLIITFCWGCRALLNFLDPLGFEGQPDVTLKRDKYYAIDSQTILQDIAQGRPVNPIILPGEPENPTHAPPVRWTQADYLKVANAVFPLWGEPIANWKLADISTVVDCADVESGLQRMDFEFFKITTKTEGVNILAERYVLTERYVSISPKENWIHVLEFDTSPVSPLRRSYNIELEEIISAEEVLRIAEENGGRQVRSGIKNCDISVSLVAHQDNWWVWYENGYDFFEVEVNKKTGQIIARWTPVP